MRLPVRDSTLIWLRPGMHVKRWLGLLILGIVLFSLSLAYFIHFLFTDQIHQWSSSWAGSLLLGVLGIGATIVALYKLYQSMVRPLMQPGQDNVAHTVYRHHRRRRGPKIVALGGGTGLSTLLRGLKEYSDNITAIVSVADDGGSSGELRRTTGILPPGDLRQCIVALSEAENLTGRLFQYRFTDEMGLGSHSFGNLFITAMTDVTGSFEKGLSESSRVLAVRGRVIPSTLEQVTLAADVRVENGSQGHGWQRVQGESAITEASEQIERIFLQPENVTAYPEAIKSLLDADMIIVGPGSLFTSVLPNLLVPTLAAAIRASAALKIYVCNVATQPGETTDFDVNDHVQALRRHVGGLMPNVLANDRLLTNSGENPHLLPVRLPAEPPDDYSLFTADLVDEQRQWRHDSAKLGRVLMDMYAEAEMA